METRGWEYAGRPVEVRVETHLERYTPKTFEEIANENGVEPEVLPELIDERARALMGDCWRRRGSQTRDTEQEIKFLYECYLALKDREDYNAIKEKIKSPEGFYQAYGKKGRHEAMRTLGNRINNFMWRVGDPDAVIEIYDMEMTISPVQGEFTRPGEYVYLPVADKYSEAELVDVRVVEELIEMQEKGGEVLSNLYHVTNSAALPGISEKRAILAASRARETGHRLLTGEYAEDNVDVIVGAHDKKEYGLNEIYADSLPRMGYSFVNWFDRWPVVFGTSRDKVVNHAEKVLGVEAPSMISVPDGIQIGEEVTMDMVEVVMCNLGHIEEVKKWVSENCPNARVVSLEAFDLYRTKTITPYQEAERVRSWREIKERAKRIILS